MCQLHMRVVGSFLPGGVTEYKTPAGDFRIADMGSDWVACRYDKGRVWPSKMQRFEHRADAVKWVACYLP